MPRKLLLSQSWLTKPSAADPRIFPPPQVHAAQPSLVKSAMPLRANLLLFFRLVFSVPSVVKSLSSSLRTSAFSAPRRYLFPRLLLTSPLFLCVVTSLIGCYRPVSDPSSL